MDGWQSLDVGLLHFMAHSPDSSQMVAYFAMFSAKCLIYIIPVQLLVLWFLGDEKKRLDSLRVLASVIIGLVISYIIGQLFDRPRPFVAGLVEPLLSHRANSSFPSNHAIIFFAYVSCFACLHYRFIACLGLVLALLTGWARVFVGIHYPFDILAGMIIGAMVGAVGAQIPRCLIPNFVLNIPPLRWTQRWVK